MFCQLYESCLENITLISLSAKQESDKKAGDAELVTLGEVFRQNRYVLFNIIRGSNSSCKDFLQSIRNLLSIKNTSNQVICSTSSPAKIKRLFGLKKSSKKKVLSAASNHIAAIVVDLEEGNSLDSNLSNIAESGFYYLPPQQYTTKIETLRVINLFQLMPLLSEKSDEQFQQLLQLLGVLHLSPLCVCGNEMKYCMRSNGSKIFRCGIKKCKRQIGFFHGTLFENARLDLQESRLLRSLGFSGIVPALIVLDANEFYITTSQGKRMLQEDPKGSSFPWTDPCPSDAFQGKFVKNVRKADGTNDLDVIESTTLTPSVKGLYFGAKWCPPCRVITKQLITAYEKLKEKHPSFEIFFCSSDRSEDSFKEHFSSMPWLAFPFDNEKLNLLTRTYDVNGIPTFFLLDEESNIITRHGRSVLLSDPTGTQFPWRRLPIYELTEFTVHRIGDLPSLILFTEGSPGDNEFSMQILKPCADVLFSQLPKSASTTSSGILKAAATNVDAPSSETNSIESHNSLTSEKSIPPTADPLQVFYTGEDPICDYILESIGQGQADLPLLVICDMIADKPDVSESIVFDFVSDYREGKLNVLPLPACSNSNDKRVGGIPVNLIEQIINQQNQHQST